MQLSFLSHDVIDFPGMLAATELIPKSESMATVAYIVAAVLFIFSLAGLSSHSSAGRGNVLGLSLIHI